MTRPLGHYRFEDGSEVEIVIRGDISTLEALDVLDFFVAEKRRELEKIAGRAALKEQGARTL